tara:strand:- start:194 stop:532 length:339 start_codon:yes stop_codon:yes gene_type:complete
VPDEPTAEVQVEQKGFYISENIMKIIQGLMVTAMLGAWTGLVSMYDDVNSLKTENAALLDKVVKLEEELEKQGEAKEGIKESLTKIETELPYIRDGIGDLKEAIEELLRQPR